MDLGLQCHVCGQLNLVSAQACTRCGTILQPAAAAAPPYPASSQTMAVPAGNTAVRDMPSAPPVARFDPATGQRIDASAPEEQPQARTMFFGAVAGGRNIGQIVRFCSLSVQRLRCAGHGGVNQPIHVLVSEFVMGKVR